MTDKMPELKPCPVCGANADEHMYIQVLARYGPLEIGSAFCNNCGQHAVPVYGKFPNPGDFYEASHKAWNGESAEEIAALKAEHRADKAGLCDEILKTLESESEYATDNIDEDRLYVRWTDVELIINKIKQRISDE